MIQQFRDVLRLRIAVNQSEGREMIDYADYHFHWLLRFSLRFAVSEYLESFFFFLQYFLLASLCL